MGNIIQAIEKMQKKYKYHIFFTVYGFFDDIPSVLEVDYYSNKERDEKFLNEKVAKQIFEAECDYRKLDIDDDCFTAFQISIPNGTINESDYYKVNIITEQ